MKPRSATAARLPDFVEPMKAKLGSSMPTGGWIYEIKFDGYRALALRGGNDTRVLSRNQKDLGSKFPEVKDSKTKLYLMPSGKPEKRKASARLSAPMSLTASELPPS